MGANYSHGRSGAESRVFLLMSAEKFFEWLEENNQKSRQEKKKWNNGERTEQMGGFSQFIDW